MSQGTSIYSDYITSILGSSTLINKVKFPLTVLTNNYKEHKNDLKKITKIINNENKGNNINENNNKNYKTHKTNSNSINKQIILTNNGNNKTSDKKINHSSRINNSKMDTDNVNNNINGNNTKKDSEIITNIKKSVTSPVLNSLIDNTKFEKTNKNNGIIEIETNNTTDGNITDKTSIRTLRIKSSNAKSNIKPLNQKIQNKISENANTRAPSTLQLRTKQASTMSVAKSISSKMAGFLDSKTIQTRNPFSYTKYKQYKQIAMNASRDKKIFTIFGNYRTLRGGLLRRGWVEKLNPGQYPNLQKLSQHTLLRDAKTGNDYELAAISSMLQDCVPHFIWQGKNTRYQIGAHSNPYRNRLRRPKSVDFTLKEGLTNCTEIGYWHYLPGVAELYSPRSYRLFIDYDLRAFLLDYQLTASYSLLRYIQENHKEEKPLFKDEGMISCNIIDFAIKFINDAINVKNNDDIDDATNNATSSPIYTMQSFIKNSKSVIQGYEYFKKVDNELTARYMETIDLLLATMMIHWPFMKMDGYNNMWILKPSNRCRGIGICILNDDTKILNYIQKHNEYKFVVQKYIERPLLIFNTKFDIRQYFLVTTSTNLTIWMYKTCYIRFSSQEFSLRNYAESIHLTNHAVQKKYKVDAKRSDKLPRHNMWSLEDFQKHLASINNAEVWDEIIYPGMTRNIIGTVLCAADEIDFEKNSFELYGCDFMINENFEPILIEINSSPDLSSSTIVTEKICRNVLEDLLKVVIDRNKNEHCDIGEFEQVYSLEITKVPLYCANLVIKGSRIASHHCLKKKSFNKVACNVDGNNNERRETIIKQSQHRQVNTIKNYPNKIKHCYKVPSKSAINNANKILNGVIPLYGIESFNKEIKPNNVVIHINDKNNNNNINKNDKKSNLINNKKISFNNTNNKNNNKNNNNNNKNNKNNNNNNNKNNNKNRYKYLKKNINKNKKIPMQVVLPKTPVITESSPITTINVTNHKLVDVNNIVKNLLDFAKNKGVTPTYNHNEKKNVNSYIKQRNFITYKLSNNDKIFMDGKLQTNMLRKNVLNIRKKIQPNVISIESPEDKFGGLYRQVAGINSNVKGYKNNFQPPQRQQRKFPQPKDSISQLYNLIKMCKT